MTTEFSNFQIPATGFVDTTQGQKITSRPYDAKLSSYNTHKYGPTNPDDYTRISLGFQDKDVSADKVQHVPSWLTSDVEFNPFVEGLTTKRVRDDQFTRVGMTTSAGTYIRRPYTDVGDPKKVTAEGIMKYEGKKWPTEGIRTFGGKNDFMVTEPDLPNKDDDSPTPD